MPSLLLAVLLFSGEAAQADPGERAFQRCAACHSLGPDHQGLSGPSLLGVHGRRAASSQGFAYSDALGQAGRRGLVWTDESLDRFLTDPESAVPGTTMPFQGGSAAERRAVIRYLSRRTDQP